MTRLIGTLRAFLIFASLASGGCATINASLGGNSEQEALGKLVWSYEENAITLNTVADERLNEHESEAHTLMLAVVQTADINALIGLLADSGAVAKLLETGKPAAGTLAVDRFIVQPGNRATSSLNRAELAKYLGIIPGYYQLDPKRNARIFRIGVHVETQGWVVKTRTATPAPLAIKIELGALQLSGTQLLSAEPGANPKNIAQNKGTQFDKLKVNGETLLDAIRAGQSIKQITR